MLKHALKVVIVFLFAACSSGPPPRVPHAEEPSSGRAVESGGLPRDETLAYPDNLAWERLRETTDPEPIKDFVRQYPESPWTPAARQLWEDLRADEARTSANPEPSELYMEEFPEGRYVEEIRQRLGDLTWPAVRATNDPVAVREWLGRHGESSRAPEAREALDELTFVEARDEATLDASARYLAEFPDGVHVEDVLKLQEEILWRNVSRSRDPDEVAHWLRDQPESPWAGEARLLLEDLRFEAVRARRTAEDARRYLENYPQGRYTADVEKILRQALAWQRACETDTVEGYEQFARDTTQPEERLRKARERTHVAYWSGRLAERPGDPNALSQLAAACLTEQVCTLKKVEDLYREALATDPRHSHALLGLAKLLYNRHEPEALVRDLLERAVAMNSDQAQAHLYLGRLKARSSHCDKAVVDYDRALRLDPELVEALFYRGQCKARIGDCRDAIGDFRKVISLIDDARSKFVRQAEQQLASCRQTDATDIQDR